ncbi:MAG TPA: methyltransferase [Terriglobales bacterium]|nr:methyltransferase [Terriglobales bacterium]
MPSSFETLLVELRERLRTNGYDGDALRQYLGAQSVDDIGVLNHAVASARIAGEPSRTATLLRLFFLELAEPAAAVQRALGAPLVQQLSAARLLASNRGEMRARLRVDPLERQYFLADLRFAKSARSTLGLPPGDEVYPASSDSLLLRNAALFPQGGSLLDLCTGSGVQGLQQASRAQRVVAVDVNARAAAMAGHNAAFNQATNVEVRRGDLYSAVATQQFDAILANPPFVVSPYDDAPSYHAGGPRGDRVLRRVLAGLGRHLRPNGRAFAVAHVGLRREQELESLAQSWFRSFPGRAAVVLVEQGTALDLAAAQGLFAWRRGAASYEREIAHWLGYLEQHRIRFVALILIAAERRGRRHVEVIDARPRILPLPMTPAPEQRIARWLDAA